MQLAEYLREAYRFAAQSKDPSNQNGAVLVSDNKIIAFGNNNFPVGVEFTKKRSETRPDKYRYFEHAERAAVYQAAREGRPVGGTTMVVPWAACCDCARAIIISGVSIVVMHRERMSMTPERWQGSVNEALEMMKEAGVQLVYHDGPVEGAPDVFVNGESWNPADEPKTEFGNWFVELGEVR
jgi:deoxycytidylate deaminase